MLSPTFSRFLKRVWADLLHQRGRYAWLLLAAFTLLLCFELLPTKMMPWPRWVFLISTLAMVICCLDFNMMLWRVYRRRDDLRPVRLTVALSSIFLTLLAVGRVLGFASFFFGAVLAVASIINFVSGAVAVVLILMARSVEDYAVALPAISDLAAANAQLKEALEQLTIREKNAHEGMTVLADDVIVEANPAAYAMFGYDQTKNELIGMRAHQLLHEDDTVRCYTHITSPNMERYAVRVMTKRGRIKTVEACSTPMMRHDTLIRVCNFRDVTFERKYLKLVGAQLSSNVDPTSAAMKALAELQSWFSQNNDAAIPLTFDEV